MKAKHETSAPSCAVDHKTYMNITLITVILYSWGNTPNTLKLATTWQEHKLSFVIYLINLSYLSMKYKSQYLSGQYLGNNAADMMGSVSLSPDYQW